MKQSDLLTPKVVEKLQRHALERFPEECIGYVDSGGNYVPCTNVHPEPTVAAKMKSSEEVVAAREAIAICHSHPNGLNCPSGPDMRAQMEWDVPFVIVATNGEACHKPFAWGDGLDREPLLKRPYRHGVLDCYSQIRDYFYMEKGIEIPEFARDFNWWGHGQDLYRDGFTKAGFRAIMQKEVGPGDCAILQIRSDVPNHAGVILENDLLLHHASSRDPWDPSRVSTKSPLNRWIKFVSIWVRYEGH